MDDKQIVKEIKETDTKKKTTAEEKEELRHIEEIERQEEEFYKNQ